MHRHKTSFWPLAVAILVIFAICAGYGAVAICFNQYSWEVRGQFGDVFGALNAFFSGLAFAGVIYAIMLQREELALQREEMRLSREAQEELHDVTALQLRHLRESAELEKKRRRIAAQPIISFSSRAWDGPTRFKYELINSGETIRRIRVSLVSGGFTHYMLDNTESWDSGANNFLIVGPPSEVEKDPQIRLIYIDRNGEEGTQTYTISISSISLEYNSADDSQAI